MLFNLSQNAVDNMSSNDEAKALFVQTLVDLKHQLKVPITIAHDRLRQLLSQPFELDNLEQELRVIMGLCGKANQVLTKSGILSYLMQGESLRLNLVYIHVSQLYKILREITQDYEHLYKPKNINYVVHREPFAQLSDVMIRFDRDFFEQAVHNIIENAIKYSYAEEQIDIAARITRAENLMISIRNTGIPILEHEVSMCTKKGWQSDIARSVAGEGSGLGLWITQHIMRAHNGSLVIRPTSTEGVTEVRLFFPLQFQQGGRS